MQKISQKYAKICKKYAVYVGPGLYFAYICKICSVDFADVYSGSLATPLRIMASGGRAGVGRAGPGVTW